MIGLISISSVPGLWCVGDGEAFGSENVDLAAAALHRRAGCGVGA